MHIHFIHALLNKAAEMSMPYFRTDTLPIDTKSDDSPVSIADKQCEQALRDLIRNTYPDHGIIGEEFGAEGADAEYIWVIDPIDGTRAFIAGGNTFANMVCLLHDHRPIVSGIGFPARAERYIAIDGVTYMNQTPVRVGSHVLDRCRLSYTGLYMYTDAQLTYFDKLRRITDGEAAGGDAYNYCRMARGDPRIVCEADLQPYDFLPLIPIVENAGGTITDWHGAPLHMHSNGEVIATPNHHAQIIEVLQT